MGSCCGAPKAKSSTARQSMFEQMTIFQAPSAIVKSDPANKSIQPVVKRTAVKSMSDATSAIRESYRATNQVLGEGAYGKVFLFKSKGAQPEKDFAVKVLLKQMMPERAVAMIREEISVLSMMDHPHIIKYVESFEDSRYMYIVTEYVASSRDLLDIFLEATETKKDKDGLAFPIDDTRKLMRMVLKGVTHMHANRVVHRDLKPANCLLDENFQLKIIDFGLALDSQQAQGGAGAAQPRHILGTPHFMAPEIFQNQGSPDSYKEPVDVWACGVMLYMLIAERYPFHSEDEHELTDAICNDPVYFSHPSFALAPDSAQDLIRKMLNKNAHRRIRADECLAHPFFLQHGASSTGQQDAAGGDMKLL